MKTQKTRTLWRNEALRWLKRFRKTNYYSQWENYRTAKTLASKVTL